MIIAKLPLIGAILRFIYRVGALIEGLALRLFAFMMGLAAVVFHLLICTVQFFDPPLLFERICALGEWLEARIIRFSKWTVRAAVAVARSIARDFSYWAAGLAGVAVIAMIVLFQFYTPALRLTVNGEQVALVSQEAEFTETVSKVENDLTSVLGENYAMESMFSSQFCLVRKESLTADEDLYNNVYGVITAEIGTHYGIYVDGELIGATERQETLEKLLEAVKAPYVTGAEGETVEFVKNVKIRRGLYPASQILTAGELTKLFSAAADPLYYTVEEGDWLEDIEEKTGLSESTLYALNPDLDDTRIIPGDKLLVSQPDVYLGVRVTRETTYTESIAYTTTRIKDSSMYTNETKVKTEGKNGERLVTAQVTYVDGVKQSTKVVRSEVTVEPVARELYVGTKVRSYASSSSSSSSSRYAGTVSANVGSGSFIRPVNGGYVSCGYWGYYGHTGTDFTMSAAYGKPVYASASGTVVYARSSGGGYGNLIKIQHANGIQTWYAHLSSIGVSEGQAVSQGQYIGAIGTSGRAYGAHLHFEFRINGTAVNAMNYLS